MSAEIKPELRLLAPGVMAAPEAQNDVIEIATYFGQNNPEIVPRFYTALSQTLQQLAEMPHLGAPRQFSHRPGSGR